MADTFTIHGLDALNEKFKAITYDMKYKGGRFALRKAAQVVRDAAKQNAIQLNDPATGRSIADNIIEKWNGRVYKATGDLGFRVGVQGGARLPSPNKDQGPGSPTPHWRLLEFGGEKQEARPFMRPAMENNIDRVVTTFVAQYGKALDRAIAKAKK